MGTELTQASSPGIRAPAQEILPELVERAGGAARFAWGEFFYAEHHNPHTQRAYRSAVRRFLGWCEREGVELAGISPVMAGQYLAALGGLKGVSTGDFSEALAALLGPDAKGLSPNTVTRLKAIWQQEYGPRQKICNTRLANVS